MFATSARIVEMLGGIALLMSGIVLPVAAVAARDDRSRVPRGSPSGRRRGGAYRQPTLRPAARDERRK
jgi:hypothetical protein